MSFLTLMVVLGQNHKWSNKLRHQSDINLAYSKCLKTNLDLRQPKTVSVFRHCLNTKQKGLEFQITRLGGIWVTSINLQMSEILTLLFDFNQFWEPTKLPLFQTPVSEIQTGFCLDFKWSDYSHLQHNIEKISNSPQNMQGHRETSGLLEFKAIGFWTLSVCITLWRYQK